MELVKWITLCLLGVVMSFSVVAQQERDTFLEKLRIQEQQERDELEQMIESFSDEEYRFYLNGQLSQAITSTGTNTATVIVDVTDMQSSTIALRRSGETSLGAMKLTSLMAQAPKAKNVNSDASTMTVSNKQWEFSNKTGNQQFEQVNIKLSGKAIKTLLDSPDVKDIYITTGSQYGTKYSAINTELGRFYPPVVTKKYDDEFIRKGHLDSVMEALEQQEPMLISVTLYGHPKSDYLSDEDYRKGKQVTKEVLSDLSPDDYELWKEYPFSFLIATGKKTLIKQLSQDDRVDVISEYTEP